MPEIQKTDEETKQIVQVIRLLRITISNILLYSASSQMVKDNINIISATLGDYLAHKRSLTISESDRKMLVDGTLLSGVDKGTEAFLDNLISNNLKSLTFKYGVNPEEVFNLLTAMAIKKKGHQPDVAAALSASKVMNIEVNEKVYVVEEEKVPDVVMAKQAEEAGAEPERAGAPAVKSPEGPTLQATAEEKAQKAVDGSRKDLIHESRRKELQGMLKELDRINRLDLAGKVVDKIAENLDDTEADVRLNSVKTFKQLNQTIQTLSDKAIINRVEDKFIHTEEHEPSDRVYEELADLLEDAANRNVNEGAYEKPIRIVKMYRLHRFTRDEGFEQRWQYAERIMKKLASSGLINILIQDLRSVDSRKKEDAYSILLSLEEYGVYALLNAIKTIEDIHLRRIIAFIVKHIGEDAVKVLVGSITVDMPVEEARRIIEVLDGVEFYDIVVKELRGAMNHYSPDIRKEILSTLSRIPAANMSDLVMVALNDYDLSVRKEAIRIAGKTSLADAVPVLIGFIAPESIFAREFISPSIQEAACGALGAMKEATAIEPLIKVIQSNGSVLKLQKEKNPKVRVAALFALAAYKAEETRKHIAKFVNDKDPVIASAAKDALRKQEAVIDNKAKDLARRIL